MPLTNTEVHEQAKRRFRLAKEHQRLWREDARIEYRFVAGHQWEEEDLKRLKKAKRPAITFNLIAPNVKAIAGMEQGNREELNYLPRDTRSQEDGFAAGIYNQTAKWIFDLNDNEFRESRAFRDAAICGMGWTQMRQDFDEDPEGMTQTPPIDPLRKYWDPSSKEDNLKDRRYDFTLVFMDIDEYEFFFPGTKVTPSRRVLELDVDEDFDSVIEIENLPDNYEGPESERGGPRNRGKIAVLEYNYWIFEQVSTIVLPDGNTLETTDETRVQELRDEAAENGQEISVFNSKRRRYYKAFFTGDDLIEPSRENADPNSFTDHCITGEYDRSRGHWFGVVRAMIDPQLWSNKLFSQILHIINSNAKGGFFYRHGAFENKNKALNDWASGDKGIEIKGQGPISDWIQERPALPLPQALHEVMLYAAGIIPRVSGFNMELLGLAGKDQPGILEQMRKQAGMTILAPFFDSLRHYRKIKGRTLIHFMKEFIGRDRIARLLDEDSRKALAVIDLPGVDKFDVHVDEAPHSPNLKAMNFSMLLELSNTNPEIMALIFDIIIEQSPMPQTLINRIQERFTQARQPDPKQQEAQQLQLEEAKAEIAETVTKAILNFAKAQDVAGKGDLEQDKLDVAAADSVANLVQTVIQQQGKSDGPARSDD